MDRYQKVEKPKPGSPINENEIRITAQGVIRNCVSYATTLLQEKHVKEIALKAMGQAISKTVAIAEIIKKRILRLHQDTVISSVSITDVWEPIEEGLMPVEMTRHVSMISITLSVNELNKISPGYQAPSQVEQLKQQPYFQNQQQPRIDRAPYNATNEDRGRGRGRGRGWNRGGYGNYQGGYGKYQSGYENYQGGYEKYQDNSDYPSRGRRGYGNFQDNSDLPSQGRGVYGNFRDNIDYPSRGRGDYGGFQDNGDYSTWRRGGGRGRGWGYHSTGYGTGYERGRGVGRRGYARGQGRSVGRSKGRGNLP